MKLFSSGSFMQKSRLNSVRSKHYRYSRKSFYEGRNEFSSLNRFKQLEKLGTTDFFKTKAEIQFYGLSFDTGIRNAIKHLGKPNYSLNPASRLKDHTLFFYKLTIGKVKCIIQIHFFHNRFFAAVIELRSERKDFKRKVARLIKRKYGIKDPDWTGQIMDKHDNRIELKDDVIPYILFKTGHQKTIDNIQFHISKLSYKMESQADRELGFLLHII